MGFACERGRERRDDVTPVRAGRFVRHEWLSPPLILRPKKGVPDRIRERDVCTEYQFAEIVPKRGRGQVVKQAAILRPAENIIRLVGKPTHDSELKSFEDSESDVGVATPRPNL